MGKLSPELHFTLFFFSIHPSLSGDFVWRAVSAWRRQQSEEKCQRAQTRARTSSNRISSFINESFLGTTLRELAISRYAWAIRVLRDWKENRCCVSTHSWNDVVFVSQSHTFWVLDAANGSTKLLNDSTFILCVFFARVSFMGPRSRELFSAFFAGI